ncbi:hypothetical protein [Aequorivita xiaoshiensis]|uniref:Uncharacterized protein n=1 Tax=Aequorivita xiaoshiensis TaxID=2874476 RepID=A0A9X1R2E9_9FLAO|nr:hypothetical protein [Aequorivita xiaoshiensis]MCG2430567.1 hypothetical protein [Aequorivita xiaoshiensis]
MEISASLIGLIILLLIAVPVGYMIVNASGLDRKVKKTIDSLSEKNGIRLDNVEILGNVVIGVDPNTKKMVYSTKKNPVADFTIVNMEEVKACQVKSVKQTEKTLDWVGLEIINNTGNKEITFYNEYDDEELSTDPYISLQNAKRWENTLRQLLKAS